MIHDVTVADRNIVNLKPEFRPKVLEFLRTCPDIFITEGYRTTERQQYLYAQGRTRGGQIVTSLDGVNGISDHQKGLAIDIAFRGNSVEEMYGKSFEQWDKVAKKAEELGMFWGFREWGFDKPHFWDNPSADIPLSIPSDWAKDAWQQAVELGILEDKDPQGSMTREMFAVAIKRMDI